MRERVVLAGVEANIGVVVLAVFLLFGVLAVIGVGALLATGQVETNAGGVATYGVGVVVVIAWGRLVVRDLRAVRVVEIEDGAWRLVGPLGIPRGTIAAGVARKVNTRTAETWIFGVPRRYTQSWAEIEAGGRRWKTCRGVPRSNGKAIEKLRVLADG